MDTPISTETNNSKPTVFYCQCCPTESHDQSNHDKLHQPIVRLGKKFDCTTAYLEIYLTKTIDLKTNYMYMANLMSHSLLITDDAFEENIHKCGRCEFKTYAFLLLILHQNTHKNRRYTKWHKCGDCEKKFGRSDNLKDHILNKHTPENMMNWFKCQECPYKSRYKKNLKRHLWNIHSIIAELSQDCSLWFECGHCEYRSKHKTHLKDHVSSQHGHNKAIYWCNECRFKTTLNSYLLKHIRVVHRRKAKIKRLARICTM